VLVSSVSAPVAHATLAVRTIQTRLVETFVQIVELKDADVQGVAKVDSDEWQSDAGYELTHLSIPKTFLSLSTFAFGMLPTVLSKDLDHASSGEMLFHPEVSDL
jgi:hypothetical protein